jgi:hypothetical protein
MYTGIKVAGARDQLEAGVGERVGVGAAVGDGGDLVAFFPDCEDG